MPEYNPDNPNPRRSSWAKSLFRVFCFAFAAFCFLRVLFVRMDTYILLAGAVMLGVGFATFMLKEDE